MRNCEEISLMILEACVVRVVVYMRIPAPKFWSSRVWTNPFIKATEMEGSVENST